MSNKPYISFAQFFHRIMQLLLELYRIVIVKGNFGNISFLIISKSQSKKNDIMRVYYPY